MTLSGQRNPNWRGGRSIASNGYMLVRVGKDHHLADVRGYAYEHRVVAEQKIGRRLLPGEQVHHVNRNTLDNRPENLEVHMQAEHAVEHRVPWGKTKRMPGEGNPTLVCACNCGRTLARYDANGRERRYISGHNPRQTTTADPILRALSAGPLHRGMLAAKAGVSDQCAAACLSKLRAAGKVDRVGGGIWKLRESAP